MTTTRPAIVTIEQFVSGTPESQIVFSGGFLTDLTEPSETCRVVGKHGAPGPIVWVLMEEEETTHTHVLVERKDVKTDEEVLTAAIAQLTRARDELTRLHVLAAAE